MISGKVIKRTWRSGPRRAKQTAYGYTLMVDGKQERKYDGAWTPEQARDALAARILERDLPTPGPALTSTMTFGQAVARYLVVKQSKKSIHHDAGHLARLTRALGADLPLVDLTAGRISAYKEARQAATVRRDGVPVPVAPATVNRELACLRTLLKLAAEEWDALPKVPRIRLEKEPEGRIRWLEADEEARLLAACRTSRNPHLAPVVTLAIETGMRFGEIMGLTWENSIDLTRGVIRLEHTKSGRRREIPMRQAVYDLLAALPVKSGRLWPVARTRKGTPHPAAVAPKPARMNKAFLNAVDAAGLVALTFHDLRHHFASWFVMRGGTLQALREILGHKDLSLTLRYAHLSPGHLRSEIERTAGTISTRSAHRVLESTDRPVNA
jgi:integrase